LRIRGLLLAAWLTLSLAAAQNIEGSWHASLEVKDDAPLRLALHVTREKSGALKATLDSIDYLATWADLTSGWRYQDDDAARFVKRAGIARKKQLANFGTARPTSVGISAPLGAKHASERKSAVCAPKF
jgi:hypothetical protein